MITRSLWSCVQCTTQKRVRESAHKTVLRAVRATSGTVYIMVGEGELEEPSSC